MPAPIKYIIVNIKTKETYQVAGFPPKVYDTQAEAVDAWKKMKDKNQYQIAQAR